MKKIVFLTLFAALAGCMSGGEGTSTRVEGRKATTERDGNMVTGTVGPAWTEEELRNNAFGVVCGRPNERILKIDVARTADGGSAPPHTHFNCKRKGGGGVRPAASHLSKLTRLNRSTSPCACAHAGQGTACAGAPRWA